MSNDTHPHDLIVELLSPEIKYAINELYKLQVQPKRHWINSEMDIFDKYNLRNIGKVIIPDFSVLQVPSPEPEYFYQTVDGTWSNEKYVTSQPILFIYEFTDHNNLVINKIHISIWCQDKKIYPEGEIEMDKYEYMDEYLEKLIELLNKLPDLEVVNLNMTHDGDTIEMLTKNCQYFKITKATELKLYRHRELKLNKHHLSDKLKNNKFKLNVDLEYMVRSWVPWTDPVTGRTRYYEPKPREREAWKDLE